MAFTRRGFLGGIIAAVTSGEALVRLADPRETGLVKVGAPATVMAPDALRPSDIPAGSPGQFYLAIIGSEGVRHEMVGYALGFNVTASVEGVMTTTFDGSVESYAPGLVDRRVSLEYPFTASGLNRLR